MLTLTNMDILVLEMNIENVENEFRKFKTLDSKNYFISKSHFEEDGMQN